MEAQPAWRPGVPITGSTKCAEVAVCLAFGTQDATYDEIGRCMAKRKVHTVDDWKDWTRGEFFAMLRGGNIKLIKHRNAYLQTFEKQLGHTLRVQDDAAIEEDPFSKVKKKSGGDMLGNSAKTKHSDGFVVQHWTPDPLVYDGVPRKDQCEYMDSDAEKLHLDTVWLAAQVDPEPGLDDSYLPDGMAKHLGRLHGRMKLAPFKPKHYGKLTQTDRVPKAVYANKFLNGRFYDCKRIVLSENHRQYFSRRVAEHLTFVEPTDMSLLAKPYHSIMVHLIAVRNGESPRVALVFPKDDEGKCKLAGGKENSLQTSRSKDSEPTASGDPDANHSSPPRSGLDARAIDGAEANDDSSDEDDAPPAPLPRMPVASHRAGGRAASGSGALTKSAALKEKKQAKKQHAATATAAGGKKRAYTPDSSDDDDGEESEEEGEKHGPGGNGSVPPPAPPAPPSKLTQKKLKPTIQLCELPLNAPEVTACAVGLPLEPKKAATRFVFVPASQFGCDGIGGWIAKIVKVGNSRDQVTEMQFKDADGKISKQYFKLAHVQATFTPLS